MRIGCICKSEDRAQVFGIALASLATQEFAGPAELLLCGVQPGQREAYSEVIERVLLRQDAKPQIIHIYHKAMCPARVPDRMHWACNMLFYGKGDGPNGTQRSATMPECDVVTVWDDDDYSPPDRLAMTADAFEKNGDVLPLVVSYETGYFVNLRSLNGHVVSTTSYNGLWGGCLAFNREAFEAAGGMRGRPHPGYDRSFVDAVRETCGDEAVQKLAPTLRGPVAFSHGKNLSTYLVNEGQPLADFLRETMPPLVWSEVTLARDFLRSRRVRPPWTLDNEK